MENREVTLKVSEHGDMVTFLLNAVRGGDKENIFWAEASPKAYHTHYIGLAHVWKRFLMDTNLIGNYRAALHCQACGLRVVLPEKGLSPGELVEHFAK